MLVLGRGASGPDTFGCAIRCGLAAGGLADARLAHQELHAQGELDEPWSARAPITRRQMLGWLSTKGASLAPF